MTVRCQIDNQIAHAVMNHPPVNSITVADTWKIHDAFKHLEENVAVRAIILSAEGKGFNAGIDIKEMQRRRDSAHLKSTTVRWDAHRILPSSSPP